MALNGLYRKLERMIVTVSKIRVGASPTGPLIEADSTRVKIPGLTLGSTAITATGAQLNNLATQAGDATGRPVEAALVSYTENGAGTYTGSVVVPAGSWLVDIKVYSTVLWTAATSAAMNIGDTDADGWFAAIDLKATDLLVGEEINFENYGGKQGVYLVAATGLRNTAYSVAARTIAGVVVSVGAGTAGRTFMLVVWAKPTATAAVKT